MQIYAEKVIDSIYDLKKKSEIDLYYAEDKRFKIAIFDEKKNKIFSTFNEPVELKKSFYAKKGHSYYIDKIELGYLKAKYIAVQGEDIEEELSRIRTHLFAIVGLSFAFIIVLAFFLSKMFLKPLRNYITKLDDFIKDTTHELNTPISAIMMSIETIDKNALDEKTLKKISRIDVAARTIFNLYQDLSFLTLRDRAVGKIENVDLKSLASERILYFEPLADVKGVRFETHLDDAAIAADKNKITLVLDNLLSNAVKYNRKNGLIIVTLRGGYLSVSDTGIGIEVGKLEDIFTRYSRFDDASGGFGIGLSIVKIICDEYGIEIRVFSEPEAGTKFELFW